eukprot:782460-Amphidinium_carterae.2
MATLLPRSRNITYDKCTFLSVPDALQHQCMCRRSSLHGPAWQWQPAACCVEKLRLDSGV